MEESFSGVVRITNASDYIVPSQTCILPLRNFESKIEEEPKVTVHRKGTSTSSSDVKKRVTVSLNDCLACNGCITSAESVLVQEQSTAKFIEGLTSFRLSVVTVSPQSVCSIAVKRALTVSEAAKRLAAKLKKLGATYIVDSSFARYLSLSTSYDEFKAKRDQGLLITSICPGFVCYAEKVHGKLLLPYLSRVRSPQAIMGSLVKDFLSRKKAVFPEEIFHATIMPCFDKKLEASRADFTTGFRQVDCVISTAEADSLLDDAVPSCSFSNLSCKIDWLTALEAGIVIGTPGGASGGYAEYIIHQFLVEKHLSRDNIRITNMQKDLEVIEVMEGSELLLTVAKCYGFRNIQNTVQKIKRKKCPYNFIEVMACPSGCASGGGQIRGETIEARSAMLASVFEKYNALKPVPELEQDLEKVMEEWKEVNLEWESWLFTDYHIVDKNVSQSHNIVW